VLTKPVSSSTLFDTCSGALGQGGVRAASRIDLRAESTRDHADQLRGARVLLVEDNEINQELAIELLGRAGISVTVAADGRQALDALLRDRFDGVLMDCQMPVMDGYAATKALRQRAELRDLPVIAMTANAMAGDREKALAAGMDDHIVKPIDIDAMFATLARWIKPGSGDAPPSQGEVGTHEFLPLPGIDVAVGLANAGGNRVLYARLLKVFLRVNADFDAQWRAAGSGADASARMRLAHTLKATAGSLGALGVGRCAADLEQVCADSDDSETDVQAARLSHALTRVIEGATPWMAREPGGASPPTPRASA
jgi:CheY-like chemotaxis protein